MARKPSATDTPTSYIADEIVKMPGWGARWTAAGSSVRTPEDSIRARIRILAPGPREQPDARVLERGWACKSWMVKMCKAFEKIRNQGPEAMAAGPYKGHPVRKPYSSHLFPASQ